jgi:predicted lysophospholipase L1 biosynthesis ABC-type transport system permease subunit
VASVAPRLPLYDVRTMAGRLADAGAADRFTTGLLACLGAAALLLAAVGIYGVVAHFVARDAAEVGVRMALGARRADVLRLLLARHLRPVVAGVAAGGAGALLAARALAARLYGVPPTDPVTLAGAAALLSASPHSPAGSRRGARPGSSRRRRCRAP